MQSIIERSYSVQGEICKCIIPTGSNCVDCTRERQIIIREHEAQRKREQRRRAKERRSEEKEETDEVKRHRICVDVVKCFSEKTKGMEISARRDILMRMLHHPIMSNLQQKEVNVQASLIQGVRNTLSMMKQPKCSEEIFFKRASLMALINDGKDSPSKCSIAATARVLNISRRNLHAAKSRLSLQDGDKLPLSACQRKKQASRITEEVKDLVFSFWYTQTRVSPNKKDVCQKRIGRKSFVKHPIHLLDMPQVCHIALYVFLQDFNYCAINVLSSLSYNV